MVNKHFEFLGGATYHGIRSETMKMANSPGQVGLGDLRRAGPFHIGITKRLRPISISIEIHHQLERQLLSLDSMTQVTTPIAIQLNFRKKSKARLAIGFGRT